MASDLVVDAVVEPDRLRTELAARMVDADRWTRTTGRRHHPISPV
jgi:acetyl-CoA carboxylase carboxyltransferase component